ERAQILLKEAHKVLQELEDWKLAQQEAHPGLDLHRSIDGLQKLTSAVQAEVRFLEKVVSTPVQAMKPTFEFQLGDYLFLEPAGQWTGKFAFESLDGGKEGKDKEEDPVDNEDESDDDDFFGQGRSESNKKKNTPAARNHQQGGAVKGGGGSAKNAQLAKTPPGHKPETESPTSFQVKVDLVADHGTSWLRINAGSVWSLVHEFAGMEDDSDEEDDDDEDEDEDEDEDHHPTTKRDKKPPVHVSKDTHPDLAILVRSLVLAADQNRIHYHHIPKITLHFAGIQPDESRPLESMIYRAIETARYSQSMVDTPSNRRVPIEVVMGSEEDHQALLTGGTGANAEDETDVRPGRKGMRRILLDQDQNMTHSLLKALDHGNLDTLFSRPAHQIVQANNTLEANDDGEANQVGTADGNDSLFQRPETIDDMEYFTDTLNLDITTLMALSSWLCHTIQPDPNAFTSPPLRFQAQQECEAPVLLMLATIIRRRHPGDNGGSSSSQGRPQRRLVVARSAATRFLTIVNLIGGPEEQWRGRILMREMIPDYRTTLEDAATDDQIRQRWIQRSEWCSQWADRNMKRDPHLFPGDGGPPKIDIVDDVSIIFRPPEPKPPPKQRNRKKRASPSQSSPQGGSGASTPTTPEAPSPAPAPATSNRQDYRDNKQGRVEWLKELEMMELHTKIFMTGYEHRITTLTANLVGYRAVLRTGNVPAKLSVWFHTPRSLAEAKVGQPTLSTVSQVSSEEGHQVS
ncbi:hypothetical protein BGZ73_002711, partial [Actinomortierella ambigua]